MSSVASNSPRYFLESVLRWLTEGEASSSRSPQPSASELRRRVSRVNDSLYTLHKPEGAPNLQIVFFHGLQFGQDYSGAHVSTWLSEDGSCIWPQTWLVEDFPRAHVFSVGYPGLEQESSGSVDMCIIGENLVSDLVREKIGSLCPVVLVGHSIGGLVIKQLCCHAHEKLQRTSVSAFLKSIKGIFFYSTPHHGSRTATRLKKHFQSPLLTYFELLSTSAATLNSQFNQLAREHYRWSFAGLCETRPTNLGPFVDSVVLEGSARNHEELNVMVGADHFSICRPKSKILRNFCKLTDFLHRITDDSKVGRSLLRFREDPKYVVLKSTMMEVRKALESVTTGPVVTLSGGPGQGKTSMARYLALYYQNSLTLQDEEMAPENLTSDIFEDGVVFLHCGPNGDTKHLLLELWESLGYELPPLTGVMHGDGSSGNGFRQPFITESSLSEVLKGRLSTEKVLIVLDDVWDAIVIEKLFFPGKGVKYLITTQKQQLWRGTGCPDITLKAPTSQEASQILTNHVYGRHFGERSDIAPPLQAAIDAVVEKADRHPVVLANMAAAVLSSIRDGSVDPLEEWRRVAQYFEDKIQAEKGNPSVVLFDKTYPSNMKASMEMALSSLPKHERALLLVAAIFKSQPIPEVVFRLFFKRLHGTLAKFSMYSKHLQSNNFIQIDSAEVQLKTVPDTTWSLHAMRQLFIGVIKKDDLKDIGDKMLECNTEAGVFVELLLLYGQDQWRDQAAQTLGIPMRQPQPDSFPSAPIKPFVFLLHAETDYDVWKGKSHQLTEQILQKYIHCNELDDNSVSALLSTKEIYLSALQALESFSFLSPPRVGIPKTIGALVDLVEPTLATREVSKISTTVAWLLTQDFGNVPESKLDFASISTVFAKLVALMGPDGNAVTRRYAVGVFTILADVVQNPPATALFPDLMDRLLAWFDNDHGEAQLDRELDREWAVRTLGILACTSLENSNTIGQSSKFIEILVEFWAEDVGRSEKLWAAFMLRTMMESVDNLIKVGQCRNVIERLVALLAEDVLQEGQFQAAMLLAKLVEHDEYRRKIGKLPDVIERLVAFLAKGVRQDLQEEAVTALRLLFFDAENLIKPPQVPNLIQRFVALLDAEDVSQDVLQLATHALANMCWDVEIRTTVVEFPNAIEKLVALLAKEVDEGVKCNATLALGIWSLDAANGIKVGQSPFVIDSLVALLGRNTSELLQKHATVALGNLCVHVDNGIKVGQFPDAIERLVALLAKDVSTDLQRYAVHALVFLTLPAENRIKIRQVPTFIPRLAELLDKNAGQAVQALAAQTLAHYCLSVENQPEVGRYPNVIDRLVALLAEDVSEEVKQNAALALGNLCMHLENQIKVGQVPAAIHRLVALLAEDVSEAVKKNAALALGNLCMHVDNKVKVGQLPSAIDKLVALLAEDVSEEVKQNAALALGNLCTHAENQARVGQVPSAIDRLVALLGEGGSEKGKRNAALALGNLCMHAENQIKVGKLPTAIDRLVALLAKVGSPDVPPYAAWALGNLCLDAKIRIKVGGSPNAIERLAALLSADVWQAARTHATVVLRNLARDVKNRIKIGKIPNVIDRLLAVGGDDVIQRCPAVETVRLLSIELDVRGNEGALQACENRLVAIGPEYHHLLTWRSFAKAKHRQFDAALADVDWYIQLGGDLEYGLQERGILKRMKGDLRGALADLDESLSLNPDNYECLKHRGLVKFLYGDQIGARADAEHARTVKPASVDSSEYQLSIALGASSVEFSGYKLK